MNKTVPVFKVGDNNVPVGVLTVNLDFKHLLEVGVKFLLVSEVDLEKNGELVSVTVVIVPTEERK